jgi:glycosyltransferase involved in cell wall biosynthesis
MNVLLSTGSPAGYMLPPMLGDHQVVCGPDWKDSLGQDGRMLSFGTPTGAYDLAALAREKLPGGQEPDVVACLVDSSWRNLPGNVAAFKCPKVLLVADTHHMSSPLIGMLRYMASEAFDRIILLYDRHHAGIFLSAGFRNLYWQPGLTLPHGDAAVRAARATGDRAAHIAFVGQAGTHHPRRSRLLDALASRGLPLSRKRVPQGEALRLYGSSLVGFNASLNGDLNLRVLEILASGAALLTDRLAEDSGLRLLFPDDRALQTYGSADELAELAAHALANPTETRARGAEGARWFDLHMSEGLRRAAFAKIAFDGAATPGFEFGAAESTRVFFKGDTDRLVEAVTVYEGVQELHRVQEEVRISLDPSVPDDVRSLFSTLPRLRLAESPKPHRTTPDGNRRRHILMITDDHESGGVAQYNHSLLLALVALGHRVSCLQTRSDSPLIREQRAAGVSHHWLGYNASTGFARTMTDMAPARLLLESDRPDLVIFSDCCPFSNLASREVARLMSVPYVAVVGFVGAYLAHRFAAHLPVLAQQYACAREVVAVSQDNLRLLRSHFGVAEASGRVIHYGRPARFFLPRDPETRERLRRELNVPADAVVCFTAARLAPVKRHDLQLAALASLRGRPGADRLHLVWAGEGALRPALEREIARLGLGARVHLVGQRHDVASWHDAADIFILSSETEGMPLAIMEAMAKAVPVIATAVSGIPEEMGETGRLLPDPAVDAAATVRDLAATLVEWSADAALREAVGAHGRVRAESMFREDHMLSRTLGMLEAHLAPVPAHTLAATPA